jgi:hypothetical protein
MQQKIQIIKAWENCVIWEFSIRDWKQRGLEMQNMYHMNKS